MGVQLTLCEGHAAAVDDVHAEVDLDRDPRRGFIAAWEIVEVATRASSKAQYLLRPDLGR